MRLVANYNNYTIFSESILKVRVIKSFIMLHLFTKYFATSIRIEYRFCKLSLSSEPSVRFINVKSLGFVLGCSHVIFDVARRPFSELGPNLISGFINTFERTFITSSKKHFAVDVQLHKSCVSVPLILIDKFKLEPPFAKVIMTHSLTHCVLVLPNFT